MAEQSCLIIIKPDGLLKSLTGNIISKLSESELKIIGAKIVEVRTGKIAIMQRPLNVVPT